MKTIRNLLKRNSCILKNFYAPIDPVKGDPTDSNRFLFKIFGLKKVYLPSAIKKFPLFKALLKYYSLAQFKRTPFFKNRIKKFSNLYAQLHSLRQQVDFPYWIHTNLPDHLCYLNHNRSLVAFLQNARNSNLPIRLIIRKNIDQDIVPVLHLFLLWCKAYANGANNVMFVAPSNSEAKYLRNVLREISQDLNKNDTNESLISVSVPLFKFSKSNSLNSSILPSLDSKYWFVSASSPQNCRGLDYSFLIMSDLDKWKDTKITKPHRVFSAALPVILPLKDSAVIITAGPSKRTSAFSQEWKAAKMGMNSYIPFIIPWYDDPRNIYKFDFYENKPKFLKLILDSRKLKSIPRYPLIDGRYLYSLLMNGIPLEALHWYASESTYYSSSRQFNSLYPQLS